MGITYFYEPVINKSYNPHNLVWYASLFSLTSVICGCSPHTLHCLERFG